MIAPAKRRDFFFRDLDPETHFQASSGARPHALKIGGNARVPGIWNRCIIGIPVLAYNRIRHRLKFQENLEIGYAFAGSRSWRMPRRGVGVHVMVPEN